MEDMTFDSQLLSEGITILESNSIKKDKSKLLGSGKFGKVFTGDYNGQEIIIKKLKYQTIEDNTVEETIRNLKSIQSAVSTCPGLAKFYGIWKGRSGKYYNLIFEFVKGETLRSALTHLSSNDKTAVLLQVAEVLSSLHLVNMTHLDIKPENIVITDNLNVRVLDFGTTVLAKTPGTMAFTKSIISTYYTAPDIFDLNSEEEEDCRKLDVWSFGVLISETMTGVVPYTPYSNNPNLIESNLIKKKPFPIPPELAKNCEHLFPLVEKCLKVNREERTSMPEVVDYLKNLNK